MKRSTAYNQFFHADTVVSYIGIEKKNIKMVVFNEHTHIPKMNILIDSCKKESISSLNSLKMLYFCK